MNVVSRKLTNLEKGMEILNLHGGTSNIVTVSRITGILTTKVIRQALDQLQEKMPFLQCRITKSHQDLYFITESTLEIPLQIIKETEFNIQDVLEKELNKTIDSSNFMIKTIVICNKINENINYLITTTHHAITDGKSCMALHEQLFKLCQVIQSQKTILQKNKNKFSLDDLIYIEKIIPQQKATLQENIKNNVKIIKEVSKTIFNKHQILKSEKEVGIENYQCGLTQRKISPPLTEKIINNCRQNKVSVQDAICAAMLISVTNYIRKKENQIIKASCRIGVDIRKLVSPEIKPEKLGLFASFLISLHKINHNHSFWDLAKEVRQQINQKLTNQEFLFNLQIFETMFKYFDYIVANPEKIANTVDVTNIGNVQITEDYGNFKLGEISFIASNGILANTILLAVTTFKQQMILNFTTSEPSVTQLTRETLANNVIDYLTKIN